MKTIIVLVICAGWYVWHDAQACCRIIRNFIMYR